MAYRLHTSCTVDCSAIDKSDWRCRIASCTKMGIEARKSQSTFSPGIKGPCFPQWFLSFSLVQHSDLSIHSCSAFFKPLSFSSFLLSSNSLHSLQPKLIFRLKPICVPPPSLSTPFAQLDLLWPIWKCSGHMPSEASSTRVTITYPPNSVAECIQKLIMSIENTNPDWSMTSPLNPSGWFCLAYIP